jgi:hypothetical protein
MIDTKRLIDFAKLAGFFEGEGSISARQRTLGNRKYACIRVSVGQTTKNGNPHKFLTLFKKYFGGNIYYKKVRPSSKSKFPSYVYVASYSPAENLLRGLLPFLEEKRKRAELAIKINGIKLNPNGEDPRKLEKMDLVKKVKELNHVKPQR